MMSPDSHPGRKSHLHEAPFWVDPATSDYFITVCCRDRGTDQLCHPAISRALLASARFYHEQGRWFLPLFLLMPDHLHMVVSFGHEHEMTNVIRAWKSYNAKQSGIHWQDGFFEHRLRRDESINDKAEYILHNPVRAGLVQDASAWPHVIMLG